MKKLVMFAVFGILAVSVSAGDALSVEPKGVVDERKVPAKPIGGTPPQTPQVTAPNSQPAAPRAPDATRPSSTTPETTKHDNSPSTVKDTVGLVRGHEVPMGTVFPNIMGKPGATGRNTMAWKDIVLTGSGAKPR